MADRISHSVKPWDPSEPNSIDCIQIVYKIAERCNLNCSYCYYYNMGDESSMTRPARASLGSTLKLAQWLAQGCTELGIGKVHISFHGGEPMLVRAIEFARACDTFLSVISPVADVRFSIQTNGTLMTEGWLEALKSYRVAVGVSIDGSLVDHDRFRLDHQGRSTFEITETAIKKLVSLSAQYPSLAPGTISVLDWRVDYAITYQYLRGLGVETMHFLLPDRNADDLSKAVENEAVAIGRGLLKIFEAWLAEDNHNITVRFIKDSLGFFQSGAPRLPALQQRKSNQILVARSDETIAIDDSLIPALQWYSRAPDFSMDKHSLRDVFRDPIFGLMENETKRLPDGCVDCTWAQLCRGGDLENRYSKQSGFNNPSVYCKTFKTLYAGMCRTLLNNGYPLAEIRDRFGVLEHV
jgi:uncharacterized protein